MIQRNSKSPMKVVFGQIENLKVCCEYDTCSGPLEMPFVVKLSYDILVLEGIQKIRCNYN